MSRKTIRRSGVAQRRDTTKNAQTTPNKHKWTSRKTRQDEQGGITKRTTNTRQAGQLRLHSTSIKTTQNKNKNQAGKVKTCKQTKFDEGPHPPPIRRSPAPLRAHAHDRPPPSRPGASRPSASRPGGSRGPALSHLAPPGPIWPRLVTSGPLPRGPIWPRLVSPFLSVLCHFVISSLCLVVFLSVNL